MVKVALLNRAIPRSGSGRLSPSFKRAVGLRYVSSRAGVQPPSTQQQDVIRRALVVATILAVIPIQQMQIPGWPAVVAGCVAALLYNIPLAYLVFKKEWYTSARWLGLILDSLVLAIATLFVFKAMAEANSASEIWLVYVIYVVTGGFTLAPAGSLLYTAVWTGWLTLATLLYFPEGTISRDELAVRLVFLGTVGLIALALAFEPG